MLDHISNISPRLLIVEDNRFLSEVLCDILEGEGYVVDLAANGNEAMEKLKTTTYNSVILDLSFSKVYLQGIEVLQYLHDTAPLLPVVVVSGKASDETILQTIHSGAFSFLLKPVHDLNNLLMKVEEALLKDKLSNHLSDTLAPCGHHYSIEGVTSDMHIFVKQYVLYFEQFVAQFKGQTVRVRIESSFDTINIYCLEETMPEKTGQWLREYLSFSETTELSPLIEKVITREAIDSSMVQLAIQVEQFATNIDHAFKRMPVEQNDQNAVKEGVFYINPIKISNRFKLLQHDARTRNFRAAAIAATNKAQVLIGKSYTIEAMGVLMDFCDQYDERTIKNQLVALQYRYNSLINRQINALISEAEYNTQVHQIINALLFDIVPTIEKLPFQKRA